MIFGGRMYTNFGIENLWVLFLLSGFLFLCSGFIFLCSYDLGSCSCVLVIWVHLLVYFYSNLVYFYVLNFVFMFLNFVKINIYFLNLYLMCHGWCGIFYNILIPLAATSAISVSWLTKRTKITRVNWFRN